MSKETLFSGLVGAPGLAIGPALIWKEADLSEIPPVECASPKEGWMAIRQAIDEVKVNLEGTRQKVLAEAGKEEAAIFAAHMMIVEDIALHDLVKQNLQAESSVDQAWDAAIENFARLLAGLPDPTLSARAADVRDIGSQVLLRLLGVADEGINQLKSPSVIVARDLTPSQTAKMNRDLILAFCAAEGGPTSHTAILAKALGIPAIVALGDDVLEIQDGVSLLVDAEAGQLIIEPSKETLSNFHSRKQQADKRFQKDIEVTTSPAITKDGLQVEVFANIGGAEDVTEAIQFGAEGVGLFRTEFLFLSRNRMPDIDEQINAYQEVIRALDGRPLVVRTLDIGGDKTVDYLGVREEPNPFLGWRAIRMISERPQILEDQLFAILKAGKETDLRIMLPMVSQVGEVIRARELLENALARVHIDNKKYAVNLQFGIMIEVPSAALMVEHFAPHLDFFSIGTNDLTQYTLAVDRMNARVANLASPFSPAVLKLIERTIRVAHEHGKWVGMCGEFAGESLAVPYLLGVGLDEFSMSPQAIPTIKRIIRQWDREECRKIAAQALTLTSAQEVKSFLETVQ